MAAPLKRESWYGEERAETGAHALELVHHGERDPAGHTVVDDGGVVGFVYGVVSNHPEGWAVADLFERVLDDPVATLEAVDGPFALACADRETDRLVVATDKIGARPLYYTTGDGLAFGSEVKTVLSSVDDPTLDEQAVCDVMSVGHVWGQKTLVEEVRALPPATALVYENGEATTERYWNPSFEPAESGDAYMFDLANRYREAVTDMADSIDGDVGLWLSGGLDSRPMAAELTRTAGTEAGVDGVRTYSYDANPPTGGNPALAERVAATLGLDNEPVELGGETFAEVVEECIDVTDGMLRWNSFVNMSTTFSLPDDHPGVVLEAAAQGELLGEHLLRYHVADAESAARGHYERQEAVDPETVASLLTIDVDPMASFRESERASEEATMLERAMDIHFRNHYTRFVFSSNPLARRKVGTRTPFANGAFLEHVARLPTDYRTGSFPFTDGAIPYGASKPKLKLTRLLDQDLASIPYEQTRLPPTYPYPAHIAGFVAATGYNRVVGGMTYGGLSLADEWYRTNPQLRAYVDGLVDDACERDLFDADHLRALRDEHLAGEGNHIFVLAPVTTLEAWIQRYLDD
nr:asparagine synthase-related protein [Halomarina oriensis]